MEGSLYESDGYFPQALINFLFGITSEGLISGKCHYPIYIFLSFCHVQILKLRNLQQFQDYKYIKYELYEKTILNYFIAFFVCYRFFGTILVKQHRLT